jgi:hypothetical protein
MLQLSVKKGSSPGLEWSAILFLTIQKPDILTSLDHLFYKESISLMHKMV